MVALILKLLKKNEERPSTRIVHYLKSVNYKQ